MKTTRSIGLILGLTVVVCVSWALAEGETQVRVPLEEIQQHDSELVEVEAIPLISTFKEEDGYGAWNLLIGRDERKLLCYEDGANIEELRKAHENVEAIIEKNEDFTREGDELQSVTVRGFYDGENEILNLTEISFFKGEMECRVETDEGDEDAEIVDEKETYEYDRTVERYIIFHEVGLPWLYAPAWWHYPPWWGCVWVDLHWGWRPWHNCGLGWYRDYYCSDWRDRSSGRYDDYDRGGKPYRSYDHRRGLGRDRGADYYDKEYRSKRSSRRDTSPSREYTTRDRQVRTDRNRGIQPRQKTYRSVEPRSKTYRSGIKYNRPTIRSQPMRSTSRSSYSRPQVSRSSPSAPTPTRSVRRR